MGLLLLVAFVLLGRGRVASAACRQVRRLARVCGGVLGGVVGEARRWTDGVGFGGRARGWACERRLWGGGRWFLVMGVRLRWLLLRLSSRLRMRRRTSRLGLSLSVSTEVGAVLARVAALARIVRLVVLSLAAANLLAP